MDLYLAEWWLGEIMQPVAIIVGVVLWTWDKRKR